MIICFVIALTLSIILKELYYLNNQPYSVNGLLKKGLSQRKSIFSCKRIDIVEFVFCFNVRARKKLERELKNVLNPVQSVEQWHLKSEDILNIIIKFFVKLCENEAFVNSFGYISGINTGKTLSCYTSQDNF